MPELRPVVQAGQGVAKVLRDAVQTVMEQSKERRTGGRFDEEILDLEAAPRRKRLALLFDKYAGNGFFDHGATRPAWWGERSELLLTR